MRVLIVEDERAFRAALAMALTDEGFEVDAAANGAEALDRVARRQPDVILLDLQMPVMTGPQFLEAYARACALPAPVIVCSTHRRETVERLPGVAAFLAKPVDLDELLAAIARIGAGHRVLPAATQGIAPHAP